MLRLVPPRLLLWPLLFATVCVTAAEPPTVPDAPDHQQRFFEQYVRPLLIEKCHECHAAETSEANLRLDSATAFRVGGDSGPAIVPGDVEGSLLVSAIRYSDPNLAMPPDEPLSAIERQRIETWIADGAYWPSDPQAEAASSLGTQSLRDRITQWWAAQPLRVTPAIKSVGNAQSTIDSLIDQSHQQHGLTRAPRTDRRRLIRRLSMDLRGLPPSPHEVKRYLDDHAEDALATARLVDRFLIDPTYGERMARWWLDLVRYSDSDGYRQDAFRPQAWRYRQWVMDAWNGHMPYDEFLAMQIAGDEIAPDEPQARAAVGFLRLGIYEYNQRDAEGQWQVIVDELTDVTADVFLATGMACAKCHDHKFDPIPRSDYFRLRSIFEPLTFVDQTLDHAKPPLKKVKPLLDRLRAIEGDWFAKFSNQAVVLFPESVQDMYEKRQSDKTSYEAQISYLVHRQVIDKRTRDADWKKKLSKEDYASRQEILRQLDRLGWKRDTTPDLMTIADWQGDIRPTRLPGRSSGNAYQPGFPQVFGGASLEPDAISGTTGRRTQLARWMTGPADFITSRVIVNRLWQLHFGQGLVASSNDFGNLGTPPTHPALLDYLAAELIEHQWDLQHIQRMILQSETYAQSSVHPLANEYLKKDAANKYLWHHRVQRLDAEQFRDALLIATGQLRRQIGGPSIAGVGGRRSLYLRRMRNSPDEMLQVMDAPSGVVSVAGRDVTITPLQSLFMLNSPRVVSNAKRFAEHVWNQLDAQQSDRESRFIDELHTILTARPASPEIRELLETLASTRSGRSDIAHILLNSDAFLFID